MKASIGRIAVWLAGLFMASSARLLAQEPANSATSSGLDAQTAILVIVLLVIVFGGLVVYELVVRRRVR